MGDIIEMSYIIVMCDNIVMCHIIVRDNKRT